MAEPRNRKLNPRVHKLIVERVRRGAHASSAAKAIGIDGSTANRWLVRGDDPAETDPRYAKFARDVRQAEAEFEQETLDALMAIGNSPKHNGGPRALEFVLSRRHPEHWQERREVDLQVTTTDGRPAISLAQLVSLMTEPETVDALPAEQAELVHGDD